MKNSFLNLLIFLVSTASLSAQKLYTNSGTTNFFVDEELLVAIEAVNSNTVAILDLETFEVASLMQVQDFDFPNDLMEEHFNENYMLTHEHPKAFFEGKISGLTDGATEQEVTIEGSMTIKSFSKPFTTTATATFINENLKVAGSFIIHPTDYAVDVPKVLFRPVFEQVVVKFEYLLEPKND